MLTPNRPQKRLDYIAKQFARTPRQAEDIGGEVPGWTVGPNGIMERI